MKVRVVLSGVPLLVSLLTCVLWLTAEDASAQMARPMPSFRPQPLFRTLPRATAPLPPAVSRLPPATAPLPPSAAPLPPTSSLPLAVAPLPRLSPRCRLPPVICRRQLPLYRQLLKNCRPLPRRYRKPLVLYPLPLDHLLCTNRRIGPLIPELTLSADFFISNSPP